MDEVCLACAQAQALAAKKQAEKEEAAVAAIKAAAAAEAAAAAGVTAAKKKPVAPKNIMLKGARMAFQSSAQPLKSPPANQARQFMESKTLFWLEILIFQTLRLSAFVELPY